MPRPGHEARIQSPDARARLKTQRDPYWRTLHQGLALGYRKGTRGGVWLARKRDGERYVKRVLARADDHEPPDGETVLDFKQAQQAAFTFGESERQHARRRDPSVADVMTDYITFQRAHRKSAEKTWNKIARHILPTLGTRRAADLSAAEVRRWHTGLAATRSQRARRDADSEDAARRRKSSANRVLNIFKAAMNFARKNGVLEHDDAWRHVEPFRGVDRARVRFLSVAEARRLVNGAGADFRPLVRAALLTGGRYGELVALRVGDFHAGARTVHFVDTKSGHPRHVPLNDEGFEFFTNCAADRPAGELMFTRADGEAWGPSHQVRRMAEACAAAKLEATVSFHDLRRTYGSLLARQGVPLLVIAAALGHTDTRITQQHYAHLTPNHVAAEVRANLPRITRRPRKKVKASRPT